MGVKKIRLQQETGEKDTGSEQSLPDARENFPGEMLCPNQIIGVTANTLRSSVSTLVFPQYLNNTALPHHCLCFVPS